VLAIIAVSVLPMVHEIWMHRRASKTESDPA
jgi:hypothetical protein